MACTPSASRSAPAYDRAEAHAREAITRDRGDIWAAHAATHVMEMQGRHREGIAWVRGFENDWGEVNNFAGHVWWHRLLFHVELDEIRRGARRV